MNNIIFKYPNTAQCFYDSDKPYWGCCCTCIHRKQVNNHCCITKTDKCTCNDFLGFYVCTANLVVDNDYNKDFIIHLNSEHGCCELYSGKESNLTIEEQQIIIKKLAEKFELKKDMIEKAITKFKIIIYDYDKTLKILNYLYSKKE